jgi:hypothetical protein
MPDGFLEDRARVGVPEVAVDSVHAGMVIPEVGALAHVVYRVLGHVGQILFHERILVLEASGWARQLT